MAKAKRFKDILKSDFMAEMAEATRTMWRLGWAERNAGNVSLLIDREEAGEYVDVDASRGRRKLASPARELAGRILLIKGTGSYFKNVGRDPERNLGLIRVAPDGASVATLWGFAGCDGATSELPSHLLGHAARLEADPRHRALIHTHPTSLVALSSLLGPDERAFTAALWRMHSECLVVFPDGIGVLPWMVPGTDELGERTREKLRACRLVLWPLHGIIGTGRTFDEVMGLIETAEKAAAIYLKAAAAGRVKYVIDDAGLRALARRFNLRPRPGVVRGL
jgi:rhamnulose-1-phosphate aldolase